jgi:hypothetical protein
MPLPQVKEHSDACNKGDTWKSAIAEHQWDLQHQVDWDETRVLDRATRPIQLKVKEALHIEKTPTNSRLNRDGGYKLPGCWIATMKKTFSDLCCLLHIVSISIDKRDSNRFNSRLVCRSSDNSYNSTDSSLATVDYQLPYPSWLYFVLILIWWYYYIIPCNRHSSH